MLAHAEIIVGAPDGDLAGIVGAVAEQRPGKAAGNSLDIGENAVTLFLPECVDGFLENPAIVHLHEIPDTEDGSSAATPNHNVSSKLAASRTH